MLAGLGVWAVLVPQGLAYGELAGLSPVAGLYTALGALLLYPLLGSSRYANVGPESSIAIVTAAYVGGLVADAPERAAGLAALLSLVTAGFLLLGALLRLGVVARLLSTPVLAGYLAGSAVVIGSGQLGKIFAVPTPAEQWWRKLGELVAALPTTNTRALLIGVATVLVVVAVIRWAPGVPGILLAVTSATALVALVGWQDEVPVIGEVDSGIPVPSLPDTAPGDVLDLLGAGASVALLIFASSMLTAGALARRDRDRVSGRREFLGLAAASVGSGLLQGFPANASDSRSFMVADARARSQGANLVAAALTAVTLLVLTPVFRYLPQAALGAVVLVASARMVDLDGLRLLWRVRRSDFVLAAVTAGGVLVVGVLPGIGVGVAVSLLEVLRRAVLPPTAVLGRVAGRTAWRTAANHDGSRMVPGLLVYRFDAPLFFANAAVLREEVIDLVDASDPPVREVVIDAEGIVDMDVTGAEALDELMDQLEERSVRLVLVSVRTTLRTTLQRLGLEDRIGAHGFPLRVRDAVVEFRRRTQTERAAREAADPESAEPADPTAGGTGRVIRDG
ncbi:SulP family inorganic anion transporter [Pseudonocardia broussonetiae]|uniref:SulP family inorganic anion transporter n=1 Tax=Pseudonocardia broussonetiae TaxID=2736640 RepID=A0A6M6JKV0_9PSEU|nr:SulP family inorganic anion transporter [Pseudonocardia broussonetiae]QJY47986.1 SulP family inorganic anion transporter [Pseudonocardia broussonetiae]